MVPAQVCPYCSFRCSPEDLFCERCKTNLLPMSAATQSEMDVAPKPVPVGKPKRDQLLTEQEALELVQDELLAEGRRLDDFHLSVSRYDAGSLDAALTPWPDKGGWAVWVRHDWIERRLIQAGGSCAYINPETGDTHWVRFP